MSEFIPQQIPLEVFGNPTVPILFLQFATEHAGEEAEAKLARQIPRYLGRRLNGTDRIDARFMAFRETQAGGEVFINTTALPEPDAIDEIAGHQKIRFVLSGKIGVGDRIRIEVHLYDAVKKGDVFRKAFETYATYTFDVLEEVSIRIAAAVGIELTSEQRTQLLSRETLLWDAFLYFLLAEDNRYGLSVGVPPTSIEQTIGAYLEALKLDKEYTIAEAAVVDAISEAFELNLVTAPAANGMYDAVLQLLPQSISANYASLLMAVQTGDINAACTRIADLRLLCADHPEILTDISNIESGL